MITTHAPIDPHRVPAGDRPRTDIAHLTVAWDQLDAATLSQLTPAGARIHVSVDVPADATGWPGGAEIVDLLAGGVTGVTLHGTGTLSPAATVGLVSFLAESLSRGLPVTWDLAVLDGVEEWPFAATVADLVHLPPPAGMGPRAREWQDRHTYGLLYWRAGGSFATLTDLRDVDQARYTIDEKPLLDLFTGLATPVRVDALTAADLEELAVLTDAHLVYVSDGWVTRLPFRLLRWPTPVDRLG